MTMSRTERDRAQDREDWEGARCAAYGKVRDYRWEVHISDRFMDPEMQSAIEYYEAGLFALAAAIFEDEGLSDIAEAILLEKSYGRGVAK